MNWPVQHDPHQETPLEHIVKQVDYIAFTLFREVLPRLERTEQWENDMTQAMDNFKTAFAAFTTKLDAFIAAANANQANSDALVAAAVAKEQAGEDVDVAALQASLDAESAKVPDAPAVPPAPAA